MRPWPLCPDHGLIIRSYPPGRRIGLARSSPALGSNYALSASFTDCVAAEVPVKTTRFRDREKGQVVLSERPFVLY
jgi:hypothetical protein